MSKQTTGTNNLLKTAAKRDSDPSDLVRSLEGAPPYDTSKVGVIINTTAFVRSALDTIRKGMDELTSVNSDSISPDGKLGGLGYVMSVRDIKQKLTEMTTTLSDIRDTFADELNNPGWGLSKEQKLDALKLIDEAEKQTDTLAETVQSGSSGIVGQNESEEQPSEEQPVEEQPVEEQSTEGEEPPPDEGSDFPELGQYEEPPTEPSTEAPAKEAPVETAVKTASTREIFGARDRMDPVARVLARPILTNLVNFENKRDSDT